MWFLRAITPFLSITLIFHLVLGIMIVLLGFSVEVAAILSLSKAKTTADPTHPKNASSLVTTGMYRFTRNPIYLGDFLILIGWAVYLSNLAALVVTPLFILYINRFQIRPEETAMLELFGDQFAEFKSRVRRWI
jgi:protein-S-isoprenylcysteine O-methyltransferase Ste14